MWDYNFSLDDYDFRLDKNQIVLFETWRKEVLKTNEPQTAAGGRFTFMFTPTTIGTIVTVEDAVTKRKLDLTGNL